MPPATRCKMMGLAVLVLLACCSMPAFGGWEVGNTNRAQLNAGDSSSFLFMEQIVPAQLGRRVSALMDTSLLVIGTLVARDPVTNAQLRSIELYSFTVGSVTGGAPTPALTTPTYVNPGSATTLTANLAAYPVQGCVTLPGSSAAPDCKPMLLDFQWAASGVRDRSFVVDIRITSVNLTTTPPQRTASIDNARGSQYVNVRDTAIVRLVDEGTSDVMFAGSIVCQGSCEFTVARQPSRSLSPA